MCLCFYGAGEYLLSLENIELAEKTHFPVKLYQDMDELKGKCLQKPSRDSSQLTESCCESGLAIFQAIWCGKIGVYIHWGAATQLVMRTVIKAIQLIPNVEQPMDVVEKFHNEKLRNVFNYDDPSMHAYIQFFGLNQHS